MKNRLSHFAQKGSISKIRTFNDYAKQFDNVIRLTFGEPASDSLLEMKQATCKALMKGATKYTTPFGDPQAIKGVQKYIKQTWNLDYSLQEIVISTGATGGLAATFGAILNPGDEVIVATPAFPGYEPLIKLMGATAILMPTLDDHFQVTVANLKKYISAKTKAIVINFPNNPSGAILSVDNQQALVEFLAKEDIFLISDEVYNTISFTKESFTMGIYENIKDKLIIIQSLSKSHSMTGWRIGYLMADEQVVKAIGMVNQYLVTGVTSFMQHGLYNLADYDPSSLIEQYRENFHYLKHHLTHRLLNIFWPQGGFYLWIDISQTKLNDEQFCYQLLDKQQVAVIPGSAFGNEYENYVRISFANTLDNIKMATSKMLQFLDELP